MDDAYCLDGQRLIAINGANGTAGTEYRTEIDTFAKIISRGSYGTPTGGSESFMVYTRDGFDHEVRRVNRTWEASENLRQLLIDSGIKIVEKGVL